MTDGAATSTGSGGHLPQCVAWVDHLCVICNLACESGWYEDTVSTCDSFYDSCVEKFSCETSAADCTSADECPDCR